MLQELFGKSVNDIKGTDIVPALFLLVGIALVNAYFFFDMSNQWIFWSSFVVSCGAVGIILVGRGNERMKLLALVAFAAAYHIAPLLRGGGIGISGRLIYSPDETYQQQLGSLVFENGAWKVNMGTGPARLYSLYPVMPILSAIVSNIVGSNAGFVYFSTLTLPVLTAVLPLVFYLKAIEPLVGDRNWALLSTYIFSLNEQFLFFDSAYSYESLGIIFFTAIFFLLLRRFRGSGKMLLSLMILALTFTHFWTDLNLVLFLGIFFITPFILRSFHGRGAFPDSFVLRPTGFTIAIAGALFLAYTALVAQIYLSRYGAEFAFVLLNLLETPRRLQPQTTFLSTAEIVLIIIGQAVLVAYGARGFLTRKSGPSSFLKLIFLMGGTYLVTILFGLPGSVARPILHRGFFFAFMTIAPVVAWTMNRSTRRARQLKALLLVLTIVSVILMQDPGWFRNPDFVATDSQISAGTWASRYVMFGQSFLSMEVVSDTFGAYGRMENIAAREPFFSNRSLIVSALVQGQACSILVPYGGHYVAVSSTTDDWLLRYYVERYYPLPGKQYVAATLQELGGGPSFNRVFNAGFISLYYASC